MKIVNHCKDYAFFQNIEYHLREKILHYFLHYSFFYEVLIKFKNIFNPLKTIYWHLLQHCPTIFFVPLFKKLRFFILIIIFNVFTISFCILMNCVIIPPLIPISTINIAYQYQLIVLILLQHFWKFSKLSRIQMVNF